MSNPPIPAGGGVINLGGNQPTGGIGTGTGTVGGSVTISGSTIGSVGVGGAYTGTTGLTNGGLGVLRIVSGPQPGTGILGQPAGVLMPGGTLVGNGSTLTVPAGTVVTFGDNTSSTLAAGSTTSVTGPVKITAPAGWVLNVTHDWALTVQTPADPAAKTDSSDPTVEADGAASDSGSPPPVVA